MNVFLSQPRTVTSRQSRFCQRLTNVLEENGLQPRSIGSSDYGNDAPLITVQKVMAECKGAVILGLVQLSAHDCVRKPGTPLEARVGDLDLPTVWNHLEAGMAYMARLPLFVLKEQQLASEGIFDPQVSQYFVHQAQLSAKWLRSEEFLQPFHQWLAAVTS